MAEETPDRPARDPAPFAPFEFLIAWRYLRARRAEGGVSTMTWISLIGIALAVFALVATLAVRAGLRAETVRTILGANAHVEIYYTPVFEANGARDATIEDYAALAARLADLPGVRDAVPSVRGQVIGNFGQSNAAVDLYGIAAEDLARFPSITDPERAQGTLAGFGEGTIALSSGLAQNLGVFVGDSVKLISPSGARTPFGVSPRVSVYEVVYIFRSGHNFVDATRAYLPLAEAQTFLNRSDVVDQIDLRVEAPEAVDALRGPLAEAVGPRALIWTWEDRAGGLLRALRLQDNALFVLLGILVLIAAMNIVSGLIMLVKNKGRDIGILRTMGLTERSVLRVFFLVGASIGVIGTTAGLVLGVLFALNIEHVYALLDRVTGQGRAALEAQGFFFPPAELRLADLAAAGGLSLGLRFLITYFPARRAARMHPVEALRYE